VRLWLAAAFPLMVVGPAHGASGPFISLANTDFIVLISFLLFVAAIFYFKAPQFAAKLIDGRIDIIRRRMDEALDIKHEAQRKLNDMDSLKMQAASDAEDIRQQAIAEASRAKAEAERNLRELALHRMDDARERIAAAEAEAIAHIRNQAIDVAVEVAAGVIAKSLDDREGRESTARSIAAIDRHFDRQA